ncbi:hypothetical protein BKA70DRAFT_1261989 [Coprinopsis sp. MPI-PUGE-AT-0042]|nr:hypothetical protein BKA70DRAFT_1261989 [Coprinopsis sp. MPI-PUGE-AT-0042]
MSTAMLSNVARASKRVIPTTTASVRAFHSPFAALDSHHNNTLKSSAPADPNHYEKNYESSHFVAHGGQRTYVVSEPNVTSKHYQVPMGAYPTSAPYVEAQQYNQSDKSTTAAGILTQPFTNRTRASKSKTAGDSAWKMRI